MRCVRLLQKESNVNMSIHRKAAYMVVTVLMTVLPFRASAQKWAVSTNAADYANLGTVNASGSVAVARHWTAGVSGRYNPWTFGSGDDQKQNRQRTLSAGVRWWPWYVYSGWWMGTGVQYSEYNRGGFRMPDTSEGDAVGADISGGYTLMLSDSFNLDLGVGFWGGWTKYTVYACPSCGRITNSGGKWFFLPNDVIMSIVYVF